MKHLEYVLKCLGGDMEHFPLTMKMICYSLCCLQMIFSWWMIYMNECGTWAFECCC